MENVNVAIVQVKIYVEYIIFCGYYTEKQLGDTSCVMRVFSGCVLLLRSKL